MSKGTKKEQGFSLRVPYEIFERLREYKSRRPHFSLNSLIVEAILRFLDFEKETKE